MTATKELRKARDAFDAQLFGDIDKLMDRLEDLPKIVTALEERIIFSSSELNSIVNKLSTAGEKYKNELILNTNKAQKELETYYNSKTARTVEEQKVILQEIAEKAWESCNSEKLIQPKFNLKKPRFGMVEIFYIAISSATLTVLIGSTVLHFIGKI